FLLLAMERTLFLVQSASAIAFSSFAVVHGAQIAATALLGVDTGNRWLLLGRPIYQDVHLEPLLVTGALTVHGVAGGLKALLRWTRQTRQQQQRRPLTRVSWLRKASGWLLVPLVGVHYQLMRSLPVDHFGDSTLVDLGHVAWGVQNRPWFMYGLHGALVV
ncbi:hypothetical protein BDF14DRAFT_1698727, partial [Spinellus fusiger]